MFEYEENIFSFFDAYNGGLERVGPQDKSKLVIYFAIETGLRRIVVDRLAIFP